MMRKSVYVKYTDFLIIYQRRNETKKQSCYRHKYLYNKRTFCALFCALFVHFLCIVNPFLSAKSFSPVEIKCLG